ncbi:inducible T-cell costimulator isoform X2 [Ornithorhynchus anatinus]|uniref:inducible T-cell costimulator isoform X2 n=1 Tax=Ornithorhynchus anatinus TaxID=9258 RepID=UPI0010A79EDA|nr:inducible T-cell costimulator isoform X2 [Ornithorhynchus anatinus]
MKSGILACLIFFQFEALSETKPCEEKLGQTIESNATAHQKMMAFHNGVVKVTCHYPRSARDFTMQLLKGTMRQKVCELIRDKDITNTTTQKELIYCQPDLSNDSVIFTLSNLDIRHADYYFCSLEVSFPPPYQNCTPDEAYLYVYESKFCSKLTFWLPVGLAVFSMLSCICCILAFWLRNKSNQCPSSLHEPNSEYMPMAAVTAAKKSGFRVLSS